MHQAPTGPSLHHHSSSHLKADPAQAAGHNAVKSLREKILQVYRTTGDYSMGPNFQQVLHALGQMNVNITLHQLRQEVDFLSNEGQLYTTIDEDHYKPTE